MQRVLGYSMFYEAKRRVGVEVENTLFSAKKSSTWRQLTYSSRSIGTDQTNPNRPLVEISQRCTSPLEISCYMRVELSSSPCAIYSTLHDPAS